MEHLLILGGAQYLPFARSRVKALRATGLQSASQKYTIEGATILIEIVGDIERITIFGGSKLEMDSGVVSAPYSAGLGQTYAAGTLEDTTYTFAYNANFTTVKGARKFNPGTGSDGQISGKVVFSSPIRGNIPFNDQRAVSFSPGKILDNSTPPVLVDNPTDDNLLVKKQTCSQTPASCFTGKTRLYVQAMYGRPLYADANSTSALNPTPLSAGPLGLVLAGYHNNASVTIDTSSGVWLDPQTRKHWLFVVADLAVYVYPLIATGAGESLRRWLSSTVITSDTKEKIEAYILSTCLPDSSKVQVLSKPTSGGQYSMGYGWHWSWTLGRADIVINGSYWAGGFADNFGVESRHYSLQMTATTVDGVTTFACEQKLVEGPARWVVKRNVWVIVEPDFAGQVMTKTTSKGGQPAACSGFFYAFYKRDELKVCRINVAQRPGEDERSTLDPWFEPWNNKWYTLADGPADAKDLIASPYYWALTISIGGKTYSGFHLNDGKTGQGWKVTVVDNYGAASAGNLAIGTGSSTYQMFYGTDLNHDPLNSAWAVTPVYYGPAYGLPGATAKINGALHLCYATHEHNATTKSNNSLVVVMVPAFDAEAVFVNTRQWTSTEVTARTINASGQYGYFEDQYVFFTDGQVIKETRELWAQHDAFFGGAPNTGDASEVGPSTRQNDLICGAGSVPAVFEPTDDFFILDVDDIEGLYRSLCSVNGAVVAPGLVASGGFGLHEAPPLAPVMVGWA